MIERKFSNDSERLFGYDIFKSDCGKWVVANSRIFSECTDVVNLIEHFEEKDYNYFMSFNNALYFRKNN